MRRGTTYLLHRAADRAQGVLDAVHEREVTAEARGDRLQDGLESLPMLLALRPHRHQHRAKLVEPRCKMEVVQVLNIFPNVCTISKCVQL